MNFVGRRSRDRRNSIGKKSGDRRNSVGKNGCSNYWRCNELTEERNSVGKKNAGLSSSRETYQGGLR